MRRATGYLSMGIIICCMVILVGCCGFQGKAYERKPDGSIAETIPSVKITFVKEDGSISKSAVTDNTGYYRVSLSKGRYWVTATHLEYEDYCSIPGFFVVTCEGFQTGNIFLREPRVTTVLLVRHAEKEYPPHPDDRQTPLSPAGEARAEKLAHVARKAGVTAVYATEFLRTQQTVEPLADFLKLEPTIYNAVEELVNQVLLEHKGDVVLVAGHSPTVPLIANQLGADISMDPISDYDNLFLVIRRPDDLNVEVNAVNLQYGESSLPDMVKGSYQMTTILLVRHTEGGDAGAVRAEKLAHVAGKLIADMTAIYASEYIPTRETVQPLADELGLQVNIYDSDDVQGFFNLVLSAHDGEIVVAAGRSDTLSEIIKELGGSPFPPIIENEYDNLFFITVYELAEAKVVSLQYANPSP